MATLVPLAGSDRQVSRVALEPLDRPDQPGHLVVLVRLVQLDLPVHLVPLVGKEQLEALVQQVVRDLKACWVLRDQPVPLDYLELLVALGYLGALDKEVQLVQQDTRVFKAHQEVVAPLGLLVAPDQLVWLDPLDNLELLELLVLLVSRVPAGRLDPRVGLALRGLLDLWDQLALGVSLVKQGPLELQVPLDSRVGPDRLAQLEVWEYLDL